MDRRSFVRAVAKGAVAGGFASASVASRVLAQPRVGADLVFVSGVVVTMNARQPIAEAVAVRNGRIAAVGAGPDIEALRGPGTQVIDLGGKGLSPGLIDAHSHLAGFGQMELHFVNIRPPRVHSFESLRQVLAEAAAQRPRSEWIVARGFNEFDEGRFPMRQEIDPATPDNPALLIHWTGQYGIANTLGLQKANLLRADVADPYGGQYGRDRRTGLPNGLLQHYPAIYSVYQPQMTEAEEARAAEWACARFAAEGVTCVHDNFANQASAVQYVRSERAGRLPLRVRVYPYVWNLEHCRLVLTRMQRYSGPLVRLQGIKLAIDGYPLMYEVPARQEHLNIPMHPLDQFQAIVSAIHEAGLQVDVHAVGDRGVDITLDAFSRAAGGDRAVRDRRHRIEHYMFRREASIARTADMGVPVCVQPLHLVIRGDDLRRKFGRGLADALVPLASFRRAGVWTSLGADVPASPSHRPLDSIRSAMVRQTASGVQLDRSEAVSFLEALEAHTIAAAYASFDENELGSVEVGKCADLAVWNTDLTKVGPADIDRLQVVATYLAGKPTYQR